MFILWLTYESAAQLSSMRGGGQPAPSESGQSARLRGGRVSPQTGGSVVSFPRGDERAKNARGLRITTYTDGVSALDGFKTTLPDLVILDIKMPRMDGMETLRRLRQSSDLPVIFLTSKDEQIDELFGLKMGADEFIRKPFSQRLLVERVKAVLRRAAPRDGAMPKDAQNEVLERGLLRMDPERHTCTWKDVQVALTVTEFLILQALASRPGIVKSRNALMDAAYDDNEYVDDRTIDSHVKRLRKKFKAGDVDFDMIETLYGVGYRIKEFPATLKSTAP